MCLKKHSPATEEVSSAVQAVLESGVIRFEIFCQLIIHSFFYPPPPQKKKKSRKYLYANLPMRATLKPDLAKVGLEPLKILTFLTGTKHLTVLHARLRGFFYFV